MLLTETLELDTWFFSFIFKFKILSSLLSTNKEISSPLRAFLILYEKSSSGRIVTLPTPPEPTVELPLPPEPPPPELPPELPEPVSGVPFEVSF